MPRLFCPLGLVVLVLLVWDVLVSLQCHLDWLLRASILRHMIATGHNSIHIVFSVKLQSLSVRCVRLHFSTAKRAIHPTTAHIDICGARLTELSSTARTRTTNIADSHSHLTQHSHKPNHLNTVLSQELQLCMLPFLCCNAFSHLMPIHSTFRKT